MKQNLRTAGREILGTVLMVIMALLIGAILVVLSGNSILEAYGAMLTGAFGGKQKITELFVKLIPTLIMALGVSIAYRSCGISARRVSLSWVPSPQWSWRCICRCPSPRVSYSL